jgi:transposase-like protein
MERHAVFSFETETAQDYETALWWINGDTHTSMKTKGGHSDKTVTQLVADANDMVSNMLNVENTKIGGQGIIVEIDETKLAKRKYNRGHRVEGVWVVGGVERTPARRLFAVPVETRDATSLRNVIEEHVLPGSIIHTDCWKGYNFLDESSAYTHRTVNHSRGFKDPVSGIHTNSIEGTWASIKAMIPKRCRSNRALGDRLDVVIWRRQNESRLWCALLEALTEYLWLE